MLLSLANFCHSQIFVKMADNDIYSEVSLNIIENNKSIDNEVIVASSNVNASVQECVTIIENSSPNDEDISAVMNSSVLDPLGKWAATLVLLARGLLEQRIYCARMIRIQVCGLP